MTSTLKERLTSTWAYSHGTLINPDGPEALAYIETLEKALRPFAKKFLYPDDTGAGDIIRDDEDWDEEKNNQATDDIFIERGWIRAAREALGTLEDW